MSCSDNSEISKKESRRTLVGQLITYSLLTGIIDTAPDLCGDTRSTSTLITSSFTASGTLTDTIRLVYYKVAEEVNVTHSIKLQTLSANCDTIAIRFDSCKNNRRNGNLQLQCNFPSSIGSSGWNGLVSSISGIKNVECLVKTRFAFTFFQIENNATSTPGGCQWSLQYNKN